MPTAEYKEHNRQKVLETTYLCFLEYGVEGTTQKRIAVRSGVTPRSIQRYFTNRDEMVLEVVSMITERYERFVNDYYAEHLASEATAFEKIVTFLESQRYLWTKRSTFFLVVNELETYCRRRNVIDGVKPPLPRIEPIMRPYIVSILEKGLLDGSIRLELSVAESADLIAETYTGIFTHFILPDDDSNSQERILAQHLIALFIEHTSHELGVN